MLIQRYNIGGAPLVHFGTISTSCALFGSIMYTFAPSQVVQERAETPEVPEAARPERAKAPSPGHRPGYNSNRQGAL